MALNLSSLLGGGMILRQKIFTASDTWNRPAKMAGNTVWVTIIGGGASGRPSATSGNRRGGNGGQWRIQVAVDIGSATSVTCTVGTGGAIPGTNDTENAGSASSFGAFLTALGGPVSTVSSPSFSAPGGAPTTTAGADVSQGGNTPMGYGGRSASTNGAGGGGGLGLGPNPPTVSGVFLAATERPAQGYGAGGSVYNFATAVYLAGLDGVILVEWPEFV